jgi:exosortase
MPIRTASNQTAPTAPEPRDQANPVSAADHPRKFYSRGSALFAVLVAVSLLIFWSPVKVILSYPIWSDNNYEKYCYTVAVPWLSLMVVLVDRRIIFSRVRFGFRAGTLLLVMSVFLRLIAGLIQSRIGVDSSLLIEILGLVIFWIGAFIACYGTNASHAAAFPLVFLLLTAPAPDFLWNKLIVFVQYGSADVCSLIFSLSGVPVLRNGLIFSLPDVTIEVEKVCSGIHSTMGILLVSLIAAHLFLAYRWEKLLLVLFSVPIVCFTNGLRIAVITLLAQYADRSFLYGRLHHQGGPLYFTLALLLLYLALRLLRKVGPQATHRSVSSPQISM